MQINLHVFFCTRSDHFLGEIRGSPVFFSFSPFFFLLAREREHNANITDCITSMEVDKTKYLNSVH